jgi:hypothetical protein
VRKVKVDQPYLGKYSKAYAVMNNQSEDEA